MIEHSEMAARTDGTERVCKRLPDRSCTNQMDFTNVNILRKPWECFVGPRQGQNVEAAQRPSSARVLKELGEDGPEYLARTDRPGS
jgi:hypothetical protein